MTLMGFGQRKLRSLFGLIRGILFASSTTMFGKGVFLLSGLKVVKPILL
jgi:hypothetical protein